MKYAFYVVAALALGVAAPGMAETLADVEQALEKTTTMRATFTQQATSGTTTGIMQMKRPGRIRFDYDGNKDYLVVADGRRLSFVEYRVRQVSQWPLGETPLGVLLDPRKELRRVARVLPSGTAGTVSVEARDPKHPEQGKIIFTLQRTPTAPGGLQLVGWQVTDSQGNLTTVTLSDIRLNQPLKDSVFTFRDPRPRLSSPGRPG